MHFCDRVENSNMFCHKDKKKPNDSLNAKE